MSDNTNLNNTNLNNTSPNNTSPNNSELTVDDPSEVVSLLRGHGLLSDRDMADGIRAEPVGRSHAVFQVTCGSKPKYFVKCFGPSRGSIDGRHESERGVLALRHRDAVRQLTVGGPAWTGPASVIVTQAVHGRPAWAADIAGGGTRTVIGAWNELVHDLLPRLAALHAETRDLVDDPLEFSDEVPWALRLFSHNSPRDLCADRIIGPVLRSLAGDAAIVEGVRSARRDWQRTCLIHGDLKHDNVLIDTTGQCHLVDWEMARIGDPAWDLAGLVSRLIITGGEPGETWSDETIAGLHAALQAYADRSAWTRPGLAGRVVRYSAVWLLMSALQQHSVERAQVPSAAVEAMIRHARRVFRVADLLAATVDPYDHIFLDSGAGRRQHWPNETVLQRRSSHPVPTGLGRRSQQGHRPTRPALHPLPG